MAFLALPGTAVLVERIGRFHALEAGRTNEDPVARLVDPDAIEHVSSLLTAITRFDPNSFDRQVNHPAGFIGQIPVRSTFPNLMTRVRKGYTKCLESHRKGKG